MVLKRALVKPNRVGTCPRRAPQAEPPHQPGGGAGVAASTDRAHKHTGGYDAPGTYCAVLPGLSHKAYAAATRASDSCASLEKEKGLCM